MTDKNVVVYTTPTWPWCHRAKEYLSQKGISYSEHDVAADMDKAREMAENWEGTPKFLIRKALSDSKIDKVRTDMKSQIKDNIENGLSKLDAELEKQVAGRVKREIDALSEINQIWQSNFLIEQE